MADTIDSTAASTPAAPTVIVGGGISGLYSALFALDSGQKNIHVYEATQTTGGKIKSTVLNGQVLNMGAEFIDSDHLRMRTLCDRLGVKLDENPTMLEDQFQGPTGKIIPRFLEQYAPVARQVRRDHNIIARNPDSPYAQALKSMTLPDYMQHLAGTVDVADKAGFFGKIWNAMTFKSHRVPAEILQTAALAYTSEVGQSADNISAGQFIAETSPSDDVFLRSDCKYRVHGGTAAMIEKLRAHLEAGGVQFHFNTKLDTITKNGTGGMDLTLSSPTGTEHVHAQRAILGLPTYALAEVKGLETFGLPAQANQLFSDVQYTNSVKFTVPIKPGVRLPDQNMFSPNVQNWMPAPGFITFLCNNRDGLSPTQLVEQSLANYAATVGEGKPVNALFDLGPGKIAFANPGKAACYATPSPKNAVVSEQLYHRTESLADQGLGIVGTYIPHQGAVGFMECGAASAERSYNRMMATEQAREQEARAPQPTRPPFLDNILNNHARPPIQSQGLGV